jgi:AmmeMemoRadiSam system protein B/AmmeMemoRadiSam system protein A
MMRTICSTIFGLALLWGYPGSSVELTAQQPVKIRPASRAGMFYPGEPKDLANTIKRFLSQADTAPVDGDIVGLWVPHAGYVFSGQIAANAYRLVQGREYDVVVIIGPAHYTRLDRASIGDFDAYRTPLGAIPVDTAMVKKIRAASRKVRSVSEAHRYEHSVEVQIPFIQTVLPGTPIVPVLVGQLNSSEALELARVLVWAGRGRKVLYVASSDMSHFPGYRDAYEVDLLVMDAVDDMDIKKVAELNYSLMQKRIPGLECVLCGAGALMTVMHAARELKAEESDALPYANSGDVSGERDRVVGYGSAVFYRKSTHERHGGNTMREEIELSEDEKAVLFKIARESIQRALKKEPFRRISVDEPGLQVKRGVFVTLMNKGRLRGCIGQFQPIYPLYEMVARLAEAAATQDYRFYSNPVTLEELDQINIKISILSELRKIDSADEIEVGKHGIWVTQGGQSGTYLPEVATELGWDRIEFLEHCCVEKAGLARDAWKKGAEIFVYTSSVLDEKEM